MTTLKDFLVLLAIMAFYGIVGRLDYDDAVRHEEFMHDKHPEQSACVHAFSPMRARTARPANDSPNQEDLDRDCKTTRLF